MHPIKARGAIREAWEQHGVRDFVLDSADELAKIRAEIAATGVPGALGLIVRIALPKGGAKLDLSGQIRCGGRRRGRVCCGMLVRARRWWGSASMSGRSASIRWPGARRWR